ncbi:TIR domain-containing protein [Dyella halodurans]|uniref:TIR domain-containing protein n=1 Tax=Dyella halodurans TaxID=1920171 RepID=A0ABV9BYL2_9GAMM|nr:TIR domain-containing protein [Dyella halodurans]
MTQASVEPAFRYRAFISYSHQDKAWADWLHKALETYAIPKRLVGQTTAAGVIPKRLAPVFRDRDELASANDLGRKVNEALGESESLIVICSPRSAASRWVNEEVLAFKRLGRSERIFCLIVDGEPNASEWPGRENEECFVPALRFRLGADDALSQEHTEPIAADARAGKDEKTNAKLKLIAGMLDVGFDALKRRELQRRHRRLTAITATAVAIMLITTLLAIDAVVARRAAERRQKQAEDLVGFMLGDLYYKLEQTQRLDIMESVDDKAMAYFESLPSTDVTDESLGHRARAMEKIGTVRQDQGHLAAAMTSFRAAAKLSGTLADAAPKDTPRQVAYSEIWAYIGMNDWFQGKLDEAQQSFEFAESILGRVPSHAASDPELIFQWANIDNDLGHVLEARGSLDRAEAQYRKMLAHCRTLVAGKAVKSDWTEHLGEAHNNLGKVALLSGDLTTSIAEYAADDATETRLSAQDPKDNDQRENMARVRAILGRTRALTGDIQVGITNLQQAIDIATELTKSDPNQTSAWEKVALYSSQLARLQRLTGNLLAANELTARSLKIFGELTRKDPSNTSWQQEYAEAQTEEAAQSFAAGNGDAANAQARAALNALELLYSKQPDDRSTLLAVVTAKLQVAGVVAEPDGAQRLRNEALMEAQSARSGQRDPRLLALQVDAMLGLGKKAETQPLIKVLWECGYRDRALLALLQREHIDFPPNPAFQQRLQASLSANDQH